MPPLLGQILFGLSGAQKAGILVVAGIFILFAVVSAMVVPERWPQFPGRSGLGPFVVACAALFVGMMLAFFFLAKEGEEAEAGEPAESAQRVEMKAVDYEFELPETSFAAGSYTFVMKNEGKDVHNLTLDGPEVDAAATDTVGPDETAEVEATLRPGEYELYCSVPGHKALGMDAKITVG